MRPRASWKDTGSGCPFLPFVTLSGICNLPARRGQRNTGAAGPTCDRTLAEHGADVLKITAAHLPNIVVVSLCAFSHVGPWASPRGFDTVVQTVSGITSRQGALFPGAAPGAQFYPVSAIDYLTGYLIAFGAMVTLGCSYGRRPRSLSLSLVTARITPAGYRRTPSTSSVSPRRERAETHLHGCSRPSPTWS